MSRALSFLALAVTVSICLGSTEPANVSVPISLELPRGEGSIDHLVIITASRGGHSMPLSVRPARRIKNILRCSP